MKKTISKTQAKEQIKSFFQKPFKPEQLKKTRRLAMKYQLPLNSYKKFFCKNCLNPLKGKIRITKTLKTVECKNCNHKNKIKLS